MSAGTVVRRGATGGMAGKRQTIRRYWLAAIMAAAVLLVSLGGVFYRRLHPTPKLTDKDTIVLADFENKTGDSVFDNSLSTALRIGLEQTPFLNLLAADKVTRVIEQQGHTAREPFTYERAKEVCARTNSAAVVTGSIADAGNEFRILARVVDCRLVKLSATRARWRRPEILS
jgi:TolB-like protein